MLSVLNRYMYGSLILISQKNEFDLQAVLYFVYFPNWWLNSLRGLYTGSDSRSTVIKGINVEIEEWWVQQPPSTYLQHSIIVFVLVRYHH